MIRLGRMESNYSDFSVADVFKCVGATAYEEESIMGATKNKKEKPEIFISKRTFVPGELIKGAVLLSDLSLISSVVIELKGTICLGKGLNSPEFFRHECFQPNLKEAFQNAKEDFCQHPSFRKKETRTCKASFLATSLQPHSSEKSPSKRRTYLFSNGSIVTNAADSSSLRRKSQNVNLQEYSLRFSGLARPHHSSTSLQSSSPDSHSPERAEPISENNSDNLTEFKSRNSEDSPPLPNLKKTVSLKSKRNSFLELPLPIINEGADPSAVPVSPNALYLRLSRKTSENNGKTFEENKASPKLFSSSIVKKESMDMDWIEEESQTKTESPPSTKQKISRSKSPKALDQNSSNYSSVEFFSKKKTIFESTYAISRKVHSLFFPFAISLPSELPSSLFLPKGVQITYSLSAETTKISIPKAYKIGMGLPPSLVMASLGQNAKTETIQIQPSKNKGGIPIVFDVFCESILREASKLSKDLNELSELKSHLTCVHSQRTKDSDLETLDAHSPASNQSIQVKISRNTLSNDEDQDHLRVNVTISDDFLSIRTGLSKLKVIVNEIMTLEEDNKTILTQVFEEEQPIQIDAEVHVELREISRYFPDINAKGFRLHHELKGELISSIDSQRVFPLFRCPIEFQMTETIEEQREMGSSGACFGFNRSENCVLMPFSKIE